MPRKKTTKKSAPKKAAKKPSSKRSGKKVQSTIVRPPATLPSKGQRQWSAVYTNAKARFLHAGSSEKAAKNAAARQAWCVVKRYYEQRSDGRWALRRRPIPVDQYPEGCGPVVAANPQGAAVGDRVRFLDGPKGQTGRIEQALRSTYWVRMDADKSLVATHAQNVGLVSRGRGARPRGPASNPSEEVVNAAYRYVASLDNLQGAMQLGNRKDVREARKLVELAETNLLDAAGAPSPIGAALAAAVGGGLGALAGPGWAALGSGVGSFVGSTLSGISEEEEDQIPVLEGGRKAPGPLIMGGAMGTRPAMRPEAAVEGRESPRPRAARQPRRRAVPSDAARTEPKLPTPRRRPPAPPARRRGLVAVPTPESSPPNFDFNIEDEQEFMELEDMALGNPVRRLKNSLLK